MEAGVGNMHKSVVYQTGVNAQQAAHYETCIQEMKRKRKRSNRNITPVLSSKLPDLSFFRLVGVGSDEWDSFVEGGLVGGIDNRWGFLFAIVSLGVLFLP